MSQSNIINGNTSNSNNTNNLITDQLLQYHQSTGASAASSVPVSAPGGGLFHTGSHHLTNVPVGIPTTPSVSILQQPVVAAGQLSGATVATQPLLVPSTVALQTNNGNNDAQSLLLASLLQKQQQQQQQQLQQPMFQQQQQHQASSSFAPTATAGLATPATASTSGLPVGLAAGTTGTIMSLPTSLDYMPLPSSTTPAPSNSGAVAITPAMVGAASALQQLPPIVDRLGRQYKPYLLPPDVAAMLPPDVAAINAAASLEAATSKLMNSKQQEATRIQSMLNLHQDKQPQQLNQQLVGGVLPPTATGGAVVAANNTTVAAADIDNVVAAAAAAAASNKDAKKPKKSFAESWNDMVNRLSTFKEKHGHCLVPAHYAHDLKLGSWVSKQRFYQITGCLSTERYDQLNKMGFVWKACEQSWEKMFTALLEYKKEHGDCMVPTHYKKNPKLGRWVHMQRNKKYRLTDDQTKRLEEVGFRWSVHRALWDKHSNDDCDSDMDKDGVNDRKTSELPQKKKQKTTESK